MAILVGLPYETLVQILSLLSCPDLASTARLSHKFHHVSQPLLYSAPCLKRSPQAPGTGATSTALWLFLQTLRTPGRETLASHVRSLRIEWDDLSVHPRREYWSGTTTPVESNLSISNELQSQGAQLMLLLDLLPHLEVIHLSPPNLRPCFSRYLESTTDPGTLPYGLKSLHEAHFPATNDCDGVRCNTLVVFLQLPNIRFIDVSDINRFRFSEGAMEQAASSSTVTHLRFSCTNIPYWLLSQVLLTPIALTHFSYSLAPIPLTHFSYSRPPNHFFKLSGFMAALVPLQPSLQYLHLDFGNIDLDTGDEPVLVYDEGSLREWPVLRTLSCSLMPLLGKGQLHGSPRLVSVLPPSLRELEILEDSYWHAPEKAEQVVEMLAEKQWAVPYLEKIAVVMESGNTQSVRDKMVVACEAAGVRFVEDSFCW